MPQLSCNMCPFRTPILPCRLRSTSQLPISWRRTILIRVDNLPVKRPKFKQWQGFHLIPWNLHPACSPFSFFFSFLLVRTRSPRNQGLVDVTSVCYHTNIETGEELKPLRKPNRDRMHVSLYLEKKKETVKQWVLASRLWTLPVRLLGFLIYVSSVSSNVTESRLPWEPG